MVVGTIFISFRPICLPPRFLVSAFADILAKACAKRERERERKKIKKEKKKKKKEKTEILVFDGNFWRVKLENERKNVRLAADGQTEEAASAEAAEWRSGGAMEAQ